MIVVRQFSKISAAKSTGRLFKKRYLVGAGALAYGASSAHDNYLALTGNIDRI